MNRREFEEVGEAVVMALDKTLTPLLNRLLTTVEMQQKRIDELEKKLEDRRDA